VVFLSFAASTLSTLAKEKYVQSRQKNKAKKIYKVVCLVNLFSK
jgi:hypothetical protein